MQKAIDLKLKRQVQNAIAARNMKEMSTIEHVQRYDVVNKVTGDTVAKGVPMEHILTFRNPIKYEMVPA